VTPLPFAWPYWLIFWPTVVWGFTIESRYLRRAMKAGGGRRDSKDAGSMWVVVIGNNIGSFIGFWLAFRAPRAALPQPLLWFWIGVAAFVAGSLLRRHCFRILGQYFTFDVQTSEAQPVIETGAYRWIRHPSYTGGVLMFAGIGLALGNWASLAVLVGTLLVGYAYRVRMEERALLATMGERYADYMRRTKRFVPFLF
jgi:protein-S-isoprenylcysteine O-methyltransferase Ste14